MPLNMSSICLSLNLKVPLGLRIYLSRQDRIAKVKFRSANVNKYGYALATDFAIFIPTRVLSGSHRFKNALPASLWYAERKQSELFGYSRTDATRSGQTVVCQSLIMDLSNYTEDYRFIFGVAI